MPLHALLFTVTRPRALFSALTLALLGACQSAPPPAQAASSAMLPIATEVGTVLSEEASPEAPILGSHTDAHGCKPSTGHAWCERSQSCERPWELALQHGFENTPEGWHAYCDGAKP